jgi:lipopolysaccharide export system protein LptA
MRIDFPLAPIILLLLFLSAGLGAETWRFSADQVSSTQGTANSKTILDGSARVESDNMLITATHLELGGVDYTQISGAGGVSLTDSERGVTVTSGRFEYDRDAKIIRFREQVTLVDEEEGIVIRCESMDLQEADDLIIMQVSVRLIKEDTICRGEFATFQMEENLLEISGRPVVWRKNDEYKADRIRVNLDTDEIVMEGAVAGELTTANEDEETVDG